MFQISPQMVQMGLQLFLQGKFNKHPLMQQFNQMMAGKTPEQQRETLLNYAQTRGYDRNTVEAFINSSQPKG